MTRLLFIEESFQGSSARSLREVLAEIPGLEVADLAEDRFFPAYRRLALRIANRLLRPLQVRELESAILRACDGFRPDALVVYKGGGVGRHLIQRIQARGIPVINVFPDCSPHAHGEQLKRAMGAYDLVISTKPFHPDLWYKEYGYSNRCVFVPHGYDPIIHLWATPPPPPSVDVVLAANWRPEYHRLMLDFAAALGPHRTSVAVAGNGWQERRSRFPAHWELVGPRTGRAYGDFLRQGRIALAPVNRELVVGGVRQPGDEDTTRTYELASAWCFFLHQRTGFVKSLYDEKSEVPLWNDAAEMAALVRRWLPDPEGRRRMADAAHHRAVPLYSIPERAKAVLEHILGCLPEGSRGPKNMAALT